MATLPIEQTYESGELIVELEERPDLLALHYLCTLPGEDGTLASKYHARLSGKEVVKVVYKLARGAREGRLFAPDSMQSLPSRLVNVMMGSKASDVDFVNAQPCLLVQLAAKHGWVCPAWNSYVSDREEQLKRVMAHASIPRDQAKKQIVSILYGGKNSLLPRDVHQDLMNEAVTLMRNVCMLHPTVGVSVRSKKTHNVEGSVMALILQTIERTCLLAMRESLFREGYEMAALKHDGGIVYHKESEESLPIGLLSRAEEHIQKVTGYFIKLVVKPMNSTIRVPDSYTMPPPLQPFAVMKAQFEKYHAKVDYYYVVQGDGQGQGLGYTKYSRQEMMERYRHLMYFDPYSDYGSSKFVVAWMECPEIRRYTGMDMFPPGCDTPCPSNVLNTWQGFAAEQLPALDSDCCEEAAAGGQLVLDHMRYIECSGDESLYRYRLGWWAQFYQFPGKKPRVGLVLVGAKGAGKDTTVRAHLPLIGRHLVCQTRIVEHVLGNFNSAIDQKLLLWVEELNLVDCTGTNLMDGAKALITSEVQQVTCKGKETFCKPSYHRFIGTTNERKSVPMTSDNRQFCLVEVSDRKRGNSEYFDKLYAAMGNARVQRWLFEFFKNPQLLHGWVSTAFPVTEALRANARASLPQETLFALHMCETHSGTQRISADDLYEKYRIWHTNQNLQIKMFAKTNFSIFLNDKALLKNVCVEERTKSLRFKRINFDAWRQALVTGSIMTPQEAIESAVAASAYAVTGTEVVAVKS